MRDPWGLNERLFALYYPPLLELAERAGQRETRHELIARAHGRTLELGAGSGINLPHYTDAVSELVVTEPSPHMLEHIHRALGEASIPVTAVEVLAASADAVPFPDASFDTVVATFILCTTPDPGAVLQEIHRVLRPGGTYVFLEHVHAGEDTLLGRFQDLVELPHRYIAAGCHPNRRTERLLHDSPLDVAELVHGRQPRAPLTVRPTIRGLAVRPAASA